MDTTTDVEESDLLDRFRVPPVGGGKAELADLAGGVGALRDAGDLSLLGARYRGANQR
jgi:hypothetical protein